MASVGKVASVVGLFQLVYDRGAKLLLGVQDHVEDQLRDNHKLSGMSFQTEPPQDKEGGIKKHWLKL